MAVSTSWTRFQGPGGTGGTVGGASADMGTSPEAFGSSGYEPQAMDGVDGVGPYALGMDMESDEHTLPEQAASGRSPSAEGFFGPAAGEDPPPAASGRAAHAAPPGPQGLLASGTQLPSAASFSRRAPNLSYDGVAHGTAAHAAQPSSSGRCVSAAAEVGAGGHPAAGPGAWPGAAHDAAAAGAAAVFGGHAEHGGTYGAPPRLPAHTGAGASPDGPAAGDPCSAGPSTGPVCDTTAMEGVMAVGGAAAAASGAAGAAAGEGHARRGGGGMSAFRPFHAALAARGAAGPAAPPGGRRPRSLSLVYRATGGLVALYRSCNAGTWHLAFASQQQQQQQQQQQPALLAAGCVVEGWARSLFTVDLFMGR
jgi:hypothetical protein